MGGFFLFITALQKRTNVLKYKYETYVRIEGVVQW